MRTAVPSAALLGFALLVPGILPGQDVPNLSGTWVLQADKSDFGPIPPPQTRSDVIDHKEPNLTILRTVVTPNGEVASNLVYVVDGQPHKNTAGGAELTTVLRWDDRTLVAVSTVETPQGLATITDRLSLSEDGKTLNVARAIAIQGQELAQTMVFARQ